MAEQKKKATYTYEEKYSMTLPTMQSLVKSILVESKADISFMAYIKLCESLASQIANQYREGAYHGDIDAREKMKSAS